MRMARWAPWGAAGVGTALGAWVAGLAIAELVAQARGSACEASLCVGVDALLQVGVVALAVGGLGTLAAALMLPWQGTGAWRTLCALEALWLAGAVVVALASPAGRQPAVAGAAALALAGLVLLAWPTVRPGLRPGPDDPVLRWR